MTRSVRSGSAGIEGSTIQKYQDSILASIEWCESLEDKERDLVFREKFVILQKMKVSVKNSEMIRESMAINLVDLVRKFLTHLREEAKDVLFKLDAVDKEPLRKRITELEEFLEEVE